MTADGALFTTSDIFQAGQDGYHVCRVPGLLVTAAGTVLATTEARRGHGGDWDANDILLRRSPDGGQTWEPAWPVAAAADFGPGPMDNFVMIRDESDGAVHALVCHNYARVFYLRSDDDGQTFSAPRDVTAAFEAFRADYPWRVVAVGPGHAIQVRATGRLVVPVWMSDGTGTEFGHGKLGHRPSVVSTVYSDDHGQSWHRGDLVVTTDGRVINPSETLAVELADGSVLLNIRSESPEHRRLISVSPDGATGWSQARFDDALLEPVCMGGLLRLSWPEQGPGRVIFTNPDTLEQTMVRPGVVNCDRKNLTVQLSYDDCRTWPVKKVIEPGPSGYSDLGVLPDGTILCIYECGQVGGRMFQDRAIRLARFNLQWVTDGRDAL